jgi:hypothetical protein
MSEFVAAVLGKDESFYKDSPIVATLAQEITPDLPHVFLLDAAILIRDYLDQNRDDILIWKLAREQLGMILDTTEILLTHTRSIIKDAARYEAIAILIKSDRKNVQNPAAVMPCTLFGFLALLTESEVMYGVKTIAKELSERTLAHETTAAAIFAAWQRIWLRTSKEAKDKATICRTNPKKKQ